MTHGRVKRERLFLPIALLLAVSLKWYITDIYLFSVSSVAFVFCLLMQISNNYVSMVHSKSVTYEDLTDEKSKIMYLIFIRFGMAVSLVVVVDYALINYEKQSLYNTIGIIGGLYTIIKKVEATLARIFLLLVYYIVHKNKPYQKQEGDYAEDGEWAISGHQTTT